MQTNRNQTSTTQISDCKLPNQTDFKNQQLELFQNFLCNTEEEKERLSNTIELWDAIPKYSINRKKQAENRKENGMLEEVSKPFQYRGHNYNLTIYPARIKQNGKSIDIFPAEREEIIEDALRKLACRENSGFMDSNGVGVTFTVRALMKELSNAGHQIKYPDLKESLLIMNRCTIQIIREDKNNSIYAAPILLEIGAINRDEWQKNPKSKWYVRFSSMVAASIQNLTYRQYDYKKMMSHSAQLSRWLHKRLSHLYTQASLTSPYQIKLSTIQRDSCLLNLSTFRMAAYKVKFTMDELKKAKILTHIDEKRSYGRNRKLEDVTYTLTPHPEFIQQIKAANKRSNINQKSQNSDVQI